MEDESKSSIQICHFNLKLTIAIEKKPSRQGRGSPTLLLFLALGLAVIVVAVFCPLLWTKRVDRANGDLVRMAGLETAIDQFESTYGRFPFETADPSNEVDNAKLMAILSDLTKDPAAIRANPQRIQFFSRPENPAADARLLDRWRHPYHIILNREGSVVVGGVTVPVTIAIWSDGPNGINEYGKGDDLCSWK